jgi:hypothetical protein
MHSDYYEAHVKAAVSTLQRSGVDQGRGGPELLVAAAQVEAVLALAAAVARLAEVSQDKP